RLSNIAQFIAQLGFWSMVIISIILSYPLFYLFATILNVIVSAISKPVNFILRPFIRLLARIDWS
ncbi:MAG: hypothetical protein D6732_00110, partial [Methanobacteriota archaeon]